MRKVDINGFYVKGIILSIKDLDCFLKKFYYVTMFGVGHWRSDQALAEILHFFNANSIRSVPMELISGVNGQERPAQAHIKLKELKKDLVYEIYWKPIFPFKK